MAALDALDLRDLVDSLEVSIPPFEEFVALGDRTALRRRPSGDYVRTNYERGVLLFALVAAHRPSVVLEVGSGRGYGSACAAWAMEELGLPGVVLTVDVTPPDKPQRWAIDRGTGPSVEQLTLARARQDLPPAWAKRIVQLTGRSTAVLPKVRILGTGLAFIDGGHDRGAVRADFVNVLAALPDVALVLLDDYGDRYGVRPFVDGEISPRASVALVDTDRIWDLPRPTAGREVSNLMALVSLDAESREAILLAIGRAGWQGRLDDAVQAGRHLEQRLRSRVSTLLRRTAQA